jgi:hypothetical protein
MDGAPSAVHFGVRVISNYLLRNQSVCGGMAEGKTFSFALPSSAR